MRKWNLFLFGYTIRYHYFFMRLISVNVWRGKLLAPLIDFLKREAPMTDVFCFQEMIVSLNGSSKNADVFSIIAKELLGFRGFFEAAQDESDGIEMGLATFIKKTDVIERGKFFVYRTRNAMIGQDGRTLGKNIQYIRFPKSGKDYTIVNFHGLWTGDGREDTEDRINQSKKLKEFMNVIGGTKIVCGDFNLTITTKSLAILDENMRNLIREYNITSTRNRFFEYPDKFCDYVLVDKDIQVNDFKVFQDEISDHLALLLDFE